MGVMLEKSKIADDLMEVIGHLAGGLRGGMGIGIIWSAVLMGATTGIVGAAIVTLGHITLPALDPPGLSPLPHRLRRHLRLRHAGPIIPPRYHPDSPGRHPRPVGRHAVRGGADPGLVPVGDLLHLPAAARYRAARHGAAGGLGGTGGHVGSRSVQSGTAHRPAADQPRPGGAGLDHRRRGGADRAASAGALGSIVVVVRWPAASASQSSARRRWPPRASPRA